MVSDYEKNKLFEVRYKQVLNIKPKEFPWQDNITGQMIKELPTKQLLWLLQREKWIILNPGKASFYPSSLKKIKYLHQLKLFLHHIFGKLYRKENAILNYSWTSPAMVPNSHAYTTSCCDGIDVDMTVYEWYKTL